MRMRMTCGMVWIVAMGLAPSSFGQRGPAGVAGQDAPLPAAGERWAILIGVGRYDEHPAIGNLKYAVADVKALYDVLTSQGGFPKRNVYLMCDDAADPRSQPRQNRIIARLNATLRLPKRQDVILIYFAGHGVEVDGKTYLLPSDATMTQLKASAIPLSFLRERLEACAAEKKFLILDACHSGAGRNANRLSKAMAEEIEAMQKAKGIVTLSACRLDEQALEWDQIGHGVFTYFLIQGLRGAADANGDRVVGALELSKYVCEKVRRWAADREMIQTPMLVSAISGDIALMQGVSPRQAEDVPGAAGRGRSSWAVPLALACAAAVAIAAAGAAVVRRRRRGDARASAPPAAGADAAKLVFPALAGPSRKVFLFAKPSLTFGRDSVERCANDIALRLLPTGEPGDENYEKTTRIPRVAGMFELRPEGARLRRLTDKLLAVDGRPMETAERKLPDQCVVSVAGVLDLNVKTIRSTSGEASALRVSRIGNAENHEYVLMRDAAAIGSEPECAIGWPEGPRRAGELAFVDGRFALRLSAGAEAAILEPGQEVEMAGQTIRFEAVDPADFKTL